MRKVLAVVLALGLCLAAEATKGKGRVPGLKHFDMAALSGDFKKFVLPPQASSGDDCDGADATKCVRCVHNHAMTCAMTMKSNAEHMAQVAVCEAEDPEWKNVEKAWQEASSAWHVAVEACLAPDRPDSPPPPEDSMFLLRRKRSPLFHDHQGHGHGEGHHGHGHSRHGHGCDTPTYENSKQGIIQCWRDMREHKEMCNEKILQCPRYALCMGLGEEPSGEADKAWYAYIKLLLEDKREKTRAHKTNMIACHMTDD